MTWEQLIRKIREGLTESGAHIRVLGNLLAGTNEENGILNDEQIIIVFTFLALVVSDLHSTVEHLAIGLDAMAEILHGANKSQEVKSE